MNTVDVEHLRQIKTLPSLVRFLRDELDWPVEADEIDELTFDYAPEELGLNIKYAKMIKEIKQIRPLDSKQPWGIFWVNFKKKRLPMVVLRRILGNLVIKKRASARKTDRPSWHLNDLLFISSYGEEKHRTISFAHFAEEPDTNQLPVLRVLGWDDRNSIMNLDRVANRLHSHLRWPADSKAADAWRKCWSNAFTDRYREAIRSADELIPRLAALAAGVRVRVRDVLHAEIELGPMRRLFVAVQKLLIHDMNEDGFADMYAQTVAYGLLSARFSRSEGLTAQNLVQLTAVSNPFLENLLENLFCLNRGKFHFDVDEVGINDVLDLLRNTNIEAIKVAFSDKNPAEDPVIRFYEGFLKQYDPQQRIKRGVFFTPRPVVSYIVRSVNEFLRTEFDLVDGLASTATWSDMKQRFQELTIPKGANPNDPFVCVLDPAVGTGTFLLECIEVIERTMKDKWCHQLGKKEWSDPDVIKRWREYVPKHLLPRLYGYELMMAPYAIAHLKLALKLGETGYKFQEKDRLHIYLTNSLEPPSKLADSKLANMFIALATEAQEVNEIKLNKRFNVVIGNPPYSKLSANLGEDAVALIEPFRKVDGEQIVERGALALELNLQDDYVKFYGFMLKTLRQSGTGVGSFISNFRYLNSPSLRGMRNSFVLECSKMNFINLGGHVAERNQLTQADDNVFEIEQGVTISLMIFRKARFQKRIQYSRIYGLQVEKYNQLLDSISIDNTLKDIYPTPPQYKFIDVDSDLEDEYNAYFPLDKIFPINSGAIITSRDNLAIDFEDSALLTKIEKFALSPVGDTVIQEEIGFSVKKKWDVESCKKGLRAEGISETRVWPVYYRPFDIRRIYYYPPLLDTPSRPVCKLLSQGDNLVLLTPKVKTTRFFTHVLVTRSTAEKKSCSHDRATQMFPLWGESLFGTRKQRVPNIWEYIFESFRGRVLPEEEDEVVIVEMIFQYIYAILHSNGYRKRYGQLLQDSYPRIPISTDVNLIKVLANYGAKLIDAHLLTSSEANSNMAFFPVEGNNIITKVGETGKALADVNNGRGKLFINRTQYFNDFPEEIWNFHIGGYQVCHKWLKDRKGRKLSAGDIDHYHKIVVTINETIKIMKQIDEVIDAHGGWPIK